MRAAREMVGGREGSSPRVGEGVGKGESERKREEITTAGLIDWGLQYPSRYVRKQKGMFFFLSFTKRLA